MFKDFDACTAWTDAMQERCQPVGLILYQPKRRGAAVRMLWVVTPGCSCLSDAETAADNLLQRITDIAADGRVREAHPVQRIDVDTSGLVLFSLAPEFQAAVDAQVADGSMEKVYLTLLAGTVDRELTVERPVGRDRHDARRMYVGAGRPALTRVSPVAPVRLSGGREATLCTASISTGRRHQIRAHAAWAGHPVVGDRLYGGPAADGLMLHAWREAFTHPLTGQRVRVEAPVPARMARLMPEGAL